MIILLFAIVLLAQSLSAAPASVSIQVLSPVYSIERIYKSMEGPASSQPLVLLEGQPAQLAWITGFHTEIVDESGKTPSSPEFMCHINLDANIGDHARRFGWNKSVSPRFFTLSQAQFGVDFPKGFGMPVMTDEQFSLATQVLNHNFKEGKFKVRHKVTVDYVLDKDLKEPLKPLFPTNAFVMRLLEGKDGNFGTDPTSSEHHGATCQPGVNAAAAGLMSYPDAFGRKFSGHWVVKPGRQTDHTNVTKVMNIPFDTTLHYINIHLHPFAESLTLKDLTTGKTVFRSKIKNPKGRIGLEHIESFTSEKGIPMFKDHEYDLISVYNNTSGVDQDAMATMFLYLLDKEFKKPEPQPAPTAAPASPTVSPLQASKAVNAPRIVLKTDLGEMTFKLYPDVAPKTVAHILDLVRSGAYNTTHFYRVESGFVAQIALVQDRTTPLTDAQTALLGTVPAEFSRVPHRRGRLSMARETNDVNSGTSSFSILLGDAPHLDGQYTVFGELVRGEDTLKKIEQVARNDKNAPLQRLAITSARVLPK